MCWCYFRAPLITGRRPVRLQIQQWERPAALPSEKEYRAAGSCRVHLRGAQSFCCIHSRRYQGWVNGLHMEANGFMAEVLAPHAQLSLLLEQSDLLRASLAGNLRDYELLDHAGRTVTGEAANPKPCF